MILSCSPSFAACVSKAPITTFAIIVFHYFITCKNFRAVATLKKSLANCSKGFFQMLVMSKNRHILREEKVRISHLDTEFVDVTKEETKQDPNSFRLSCLVSSQNLAHQVFWMVASPPT
jgi:hypothetical protein